MQKTLPNGKWRKRLKIKALPPFAELHKVRAGTCKIFKIKKLGLSVDKTLITTISRVCRVPATNYNSINILREDYERFLSYYLVPVIRHDNNQYEPLMEYCIEKTEIYFRNADEIDENDIDIPVLRRIKK